MRSESGPSRPRRLLRALRRQVLLRRRLLAAVAVGLAVLAALRVTSPPPGPVTMVPTAARDLPAGTLLASGDVTMAERPSDLAPADAARAPVGRVLAGPVSRGEALTDLRMVGPALAEAMPGETLVPIRLPDAGMAALLRPGDEVDLLATDPATGDAELVATRVSVVALPRDVGDGPVTGSGTPSGALVLVSVAPTVALELTAASLSRFLTVTW